MFEWLTELTNEPLYLDTGIHIAGRNEIIDSCRRIEECSDVFMRFLSEGMYVNIHGSSLRAYDFRAGGLVVRGCIDRIEFEERNRKHGSEDKKHHKDKRPGEGTL